MIGEKKSTPRSGAICMYKRFFVIAVFLMVCSSYAVALVDMRIANYSDTWTDYRGEFPGYTFQIERSYNSRSLFQGMFGFGWCSDLETQLLYTAEGGLQVVLCGDGTRFNFVPKGPSNQDVKKSVDRIVAHVQSMALDSNSEFGKLFEGMSSAAWEQFRAALLVDQKTRNKLADTLGLLKAPSTETEFLSPQTGERIQFKSGSFTWERKGGETLQFNEKGNLVAIRQKPEAPLLTLIYDGDQVISISDPDGRTFQLEYEGTNLLKSIRTPDGKSTKYKHSSKDDLIQ